MAEKRFGLLFFLKQSKKNKNGEKYISIRITVEGIPKELSTKRLWSSSKWNPSDGRVIGNTEESRLLIAYLDTLTYKAIQAKKIPLHQEDLKNTLSFF